MRLRIFEKEHAVSSKVDRLVEVMDHVLQQPGQAATLSQIASAVGHPMSSTHDLLRAMVAAGLLEVDAAKQYRTGPVMLRLAVSAIDQVDIAATARRHLDHLVGEVSHDAYLAIRAGDTVSYVARVAGRHRAGLDIRLGEPVPLHCSAVGKLYAALHPDLERLVMRRKLRALTPLTITDPVALAEELERIRERDLALSMEETISGIVGFAAPVRDADRRVVAGVHVSAFKDNLAEGDIPRIARAAQQCAADIEEALRATSLTKVMA
jgi:IclR family acetate operon transcriptional repressor